MADLPQIRKYENRFGKIKSYFRAQEIMDLARESLQERQVEFLKAMREKLKKKRKGNNKVRFVIRGSSGKEIAFVNLNIDIKNQKLEIQEISTGEVVRNAFKENDPLRRLGIGTMMLDRIKQYARSRNIKNITLKCHKDRIPFYNKSGFSDKGPIFPGAFYHTMEYIIHQ
jgi:GNAT superfamily N-acetyltransferase